MTECRFAAKRTFPTREWARQGMRDIRAAVWARGVRYDTLYPYRCPNGSHWHLSHYRQGYAMCPVCGQRQQAWFGGKVWVIAAHGGCAGEGQHA